MVPMAKNVGIVVLGAAGYMGSYNFLPCLPHVKRAVELQGIRLEILLLADYKYFSKDEEVAASARSRAQELLRPKQG
jgi:hypothetical protein